MMERDTNRHDESPASMRNSRRNGAVARAGRQRADPVRYLAIPQ
jgi:hypothetical protein